jgi:xylose isomerase
VSHAVFIGHREYFKGIQKIEYEGAESDNPLAFKFYRPEQRIGGKTMAEHLRFAVCYWHSFCGHGADPFGPGTRTYPWDDKTDAMDRAKQRQDAAFEFFTKLDAPFYCFHDRDMAPEGENVLESENNLHTLVEMAKEKQALTGVKLLWGTANLFSHPRYMNGAMTNPDFKVVAHAAAQVKAALDATVILNGENYVFWGGREGYASLFNTDTRREQEHMGLFLIMARDYGRSIGFKGKFLIEPKPMEPMKHHYNFDAETVIGFLRRFDLENDFALNIEANHATLAGHSFAHELQMSADAGLLGSIDANRGDPQNGWDTDQFPVDIYDSVQAMMVLLADGGFKTGGLNFDARLRRESTGPEDLFMGHIGAMDCFARGLEIAHRILTQSDLPAFKRQRYQSFYTGNGKLFAESKLSLLDLWTYAAANGQPTQHSGKQEWVENIINQYLWRASAPC